MEKALKVIDRIVSILASILFILLLVCISVLPIAKSKSYYMNQHHKNDVVGILNEYTFNGKKHYQAGENGEVFEYYYPDDYEATWSDVEKATEHIIDYLYHKDVESMQFQIEHEGKKYDFFTNQAIVHMVDVKVLFIGGINLCYLCIVLFVLCVAYLIYRRHFIKEYIVKTYLITVGVFFVVVLAAIIFAAIDFNVAFTVFHYLIFNSSDAELAISFSYYDTLTNVLTSEFFMSIGLAIGITFICLLVVSVIVCVLLKKFGNKLFLKN